MIKPVYLIVYVWIGFQRKKRHNFCNFVSEMQINCRKCLSEDRLCSKILRVGFFYRTSDSQWIQRFRCKLCNSSFSQASFQFCYKQKKRHKNEILRKLLASGVSLNRASLLLNIHRITTVRKTLFLGLVSEYRFRSDNWKRSKVTAIQFDDLETFESTKCKPLSITLAVEKGTRRILGIEVSQMPSNGLLAHKSRRLYGNRKDERRDARQRLFRKLGDLVVSEVKIESDKNPAYARDVRRFFPNAQYKQFKGMRGASTGQGELKKGGYDPLFSLNHTCAMLRANINRLFRKTWCTTKNRDRLYAHLMIYANFHNESLI